MATASANELARVALSSAQELGIEPGTLALCFGYSTGQWAVANGSLKGDLRRPCPRLAGDQLVRAHPARARSVHD